MESILRNNGRGWVLEIDAGNTTGVDKEQMARDALAAHYLEPGAVTIAYVNASTREDDL